MFFCALVKQTGRKITSLTLFLKCVKLCPHSTRLAEQAFSKLFRYYYSFFPFPSLPLTPDSVYKLLNVSLEFATPDVKYEDTVNVNMNTGVQSCVSLVGDMAMLTTTSVTCENCEFLSRPKTQGLF